MWKYLGGCHPLTLVDVESTDRIFVQCINELRVLQRESVNEDDVTSAVDDMF